MNNKLLLTSAFIAASVGAFAQSGKHSNKTYAITGDGSSDYIWMNIRQVDLNSGQVINTLFERSKSNFLMTDVQSRRVIDQASLQNQNIFQATEYPTGTLVAAAAYDANSNKLFFTPMRNGELRWLDLNEQSGTPHFYTLKSDLLKQANPADESLNITRMVIGADGYGYAMSNDGYRFLRFTTGAKPVITDLGAVIDADGSKGTSIHNRCSSWGGDMLADAYGKLYVISANHNVFVIDPATRIATYKGAINGLPAGYTTNSAAVDQEGNIVVASANKFSGYYKLKLDDLTAVKVEGSDNNYSASDFANGNLLLQKEADAARQAALGSANIPTAKINSSNAHVFPNPVTDGTFNVLLDNQQEGRYTIVVSDLSGRNIQSRNVQLTGKGTQVQKMSLGVATKGVYMVKVLDANAQIVLVEKIVVQ
jgi:lipocalin